MSNISMLCKELTQSQFNQEEIHLTDLSQKLDSILAPLRSVPIIEKTLISELKEIVNSATHTLTAVTKVDSLILDKNNLFIPKDNLDSLKRAYPQGNIVDQLREVGQDVEKTTDHIQTISQRLVDVTNRLNIISQELTNKQHDIKDQDDIPERIASIMDNLKQKDELIYKLLHENFKVSKEMDSVVAGSVKRIKYYEFFEVRIIEIIKILNEVFQEIKGCEIKKEDAEDMEFLKNLYTMESEHKIHESILDGEQSIQAKQSDDSEKEESDDVELF
jgi:uncharacterized coiled-coil DUF342 family protein